MSAISCADTNQLVYVPPWLPKYESNPVNPALARSYTKKLVAHTEKLVELG